MKIDENARIIISKKSEKDTCNNKYIKAKSVLSENGRTTIHIDIKHSKHPTIRSIINYIKNIFNRSEHFFSLKDTEFLLKAAANEQSITPNQFGKMDNLAKSLIRQVHFIDYSQKIDGFETEEHKKIREDRHNKLPEKAKTKEKLARALSKAKKLGKGLQKNPNAKLLTGAYWPEAIVSKEFHSSAMESLFKVWKETDTDLDFETWIKKEFPDHPLPPLAYLDKNERKEYLVSIQNGMLVSADDNKTPKDTTEYNSLFSGQGFAIFVLAPDSSLYIGEHKIGKFHHSSFLSGAPTLSAGEIKTNSEGKILCVTSKSGHYRPSKAELVNILSHLESHGVNLKDVVVKELSKHNVTAYYNNGAEYVENRGDLKPSYICIREESCNQVNGPIKYRLETNVFGQVKLVPFQDNTESPTENDIQEVKKLMEELGIKNYKLL